MKTDSKSGAMLVVVTLIMMVISIITIGLFKLYQDDAVEAVHVDKSGQAFWLAETGLQRALDKLRTEKPYRTNPYTLTESVGDGSYTATVVEDYTTNDTWNITVTGTVGNVSRVITLDPYLHAEIGYGVMGLGGDSKLDKTGEIDANVYSFGKLTVNGRSAPSINGDVNALDTRNLDYNPITANNKVDMEVDTSSWDFTQAGDPPTYITTNVVVFDILGVPIATNSYKYLDLTGGKTVKVDGNYDLDIDADGTIGDGTFIVDGDLKFPATVGTSYTIKSGATIMVNGDFTAKKEGTLEDDVTILVNGDVTISKTGSGSTCTILATGDMTVDKSLEFNGLIFCDGSVTVDGDLTLYGSLIAGEDFWLKAGYDIEYDGGQIPQDILDNMIVYVTYATDPGTWNEWTFF